MTVHSILPSATRRAALAGLGLAGLAGLTACGAGSRNPAEQAAKVACEVPQPDSAVTINVLAYNSSSIDPFTNTLVNSCTSGNITLRHEPIDFAGQVQRTQATLAGETGTYDIIETYSFVIPQFGDEGTVVGLNQYLEEFGEAYGLDALSDAMLEAMTYDGELYALPMQAQMHLMAYRQDIFDELGLEAPATFEELRAAAKAIQEAGEIEHPIAMPLKADADLATAYDMALGSLGVDMTDAEGTTGNFDAPEAAQAFEELMSLIPYMDPEVTTFDQPSVQQQMYNGTAAIAIMFSGRMNDLTMESNTELAPQFAFAPPPTVVEGGHYFASLSVDGWSIPTNASTDKASLFQMIASSLSEEASREAVPAAYPAREGMVDEDSSPYAVAANTTIEDVPPSEPYPWTAELTNAITPLIASVFLEQVSVEDGLSQMQTTSADLLAAYSG
ncbi:ABC transporter substrate-binding protein [Brachybacterium sp.]|uniref:ABC transporter substrate-binding protein n=1 Tax=Brachybacterium sp. TaxID=1891286 RepID=UPI002ED3B5EA